MFFKCVGLEDAVFYNLTHTNKSHLFDYYYCHIYCYLFLLLKSQQHCWCQSGHKMLFTRSIHPSVLIIIIRPEKAHLLKIPYVHAVSLWFYYVLWLTAGGGNGCCTCSVLKILVFFVRMPHQSVFPSCFFINYLVFVSLIKLQWFLMVGSAQVTWFKVDDGFAGNRSVTGRKRIKKPQKINSRNFLVCKND